MADINIFTTEDWSKFNEEGFDVILDPMIYRTGEVFLRGAKKTDTPDEKWEDITNNWGALFAFFDHIILKEQLPIIDYSSTYEPELPFQERPLVEAINRENKILYDIHVEADAYLASKSAALDTLTQKKDFEPMLVSEILDEMSAFEYDWKPDISNLGDMSEKQRSFNTFLLGGLLFGAYAQQTGSEHVLHPKRSGLFLAASLNSKTAKYEMEEALFSKLIEISKNTPENVIRTVNLPIAPTFLPYLLTFNDETADQLLQRALKLRDENEVRQYRAWRKETVKELEKGRLPSEKDKEMIQLADAIERKLTPKEWSVKLNLSLSNIGTNVEILNTRIWGWMLRQLPQKSYRKLLMRLTIAGKEYVQLDKALKKVWDG